MVYIHLGLKTSYLEKRIGPQIQTLVARFVPESNKLLNQAHHPMFQERFRSQRRHQNQSQLKCMHLDTMQVRTVRSLKMISAKRSMSKNGLRTSCPKRQN